MRPLRGRLQTDRRTLKLHYLIVTTASDTLDSTDGVTSLREAIFFASSGSFGGNTVTFASGAGDAFENGGVIRLTQGATVVLDADVTIDGSTAGGTLIITGDVSGDDTKVGSSMITDAIANTNTSDNVRVFGITGGTVNLIDLTITGGFTTSDGGGIFVGSGATLNYSVVGGSSGEVTLMCPKDSDYFEPGRLQRDSGIVHGTVR